MKPGKQETAQRVSIAKKIGLIGLVGALLLLSSAQSFEPGMKLYRAKPEDVLLWAEQGNFRFIRLDGGARLPFTAVAHLTRCAAECAVRFEPMRANTGFFATSTECFRAG